MRNMNIMQQKSIKTRTRILLSIALFLLAAASAQSAEAGTIVVTVTADDGPGSLRQALVQASDGDTINITARGTITLTGGELVVDKSLTIRGPGAANLAVSGNAVSRVFHVMPDTTVVIAGLTIGDGRAIESDYPANSGGGIYNQRARLTVNNCDVQSNSAYYGGAIFNDAQSGSATLTLNNSTVRLNSSTYAGGGIVNSGRFGNAVLILNGSTVRRNLAAFGNGGGVYNNGESGVASFTLIQSTVSANSAASDGGGIFNDGKNGSATTALTNSGVNGNLAGVPLNGGSGGGIYNEGKFGNAVVTMDHSTMNDNSIQQFGHGVGLYNDGSFSGTATATLTNSTVSGNSCRFESSGGGISNNGDFSGNARLTLIQSIVSGNSSEIGGGIYNSTKSLDENNAAGNATVTLNNSSVRDNYARYFGGGIVSLAANSATATAGLTLIDSTVNNNWAALGGGISNEGSELGTAHLTLINSTVSNNSADVGGGIATSGFGGTGTATLTNSTVSANSAIYGGGILNSASFGSSGSQGGLSTVTLNNCTLAANLSAGEGNNILGNILNVNGGGSNAILDIANTLVKAGGLGVSIQNLSGTVVSRGYNLSNDSADGDGATGPGGLLNAPGDIRNTDPLLGPLKNNGGPTKTHALLLNSPAIDAGDPNFNTNTFDPPLLYDQRNGSGFVRVVNGCIDIGAFESRHP